MATRIVFHVGLAKTGTTSLQHDWHRHRRRLARAGVLYPRTCEGLAKNHSALAASYLAHRPHDPTIALRAPPRDKAVAALRAEIAASRCDVALVSSEHFSIHFDPHEAHVLAEDFRDLDPTIVIAIREPYGRFLSMWNTHVTAGGSLGLEDFARTLLVPDNRFFSIREIVGIWHAAFGPERVRVVDYDGVPDIGAAILRLCGMDAALPRGRRRRASLPLEAISTLRAVNAALAARQSAPRESFASWAQHTAFSLLAQRRLVRHASEGGRPIVSEQTMAALDAIWENDRLFLDETLGHALASTRERYRIGTPAAPADEARQAEARRADALLREVSRGLWGPSEALVALWQRCAPAVSHLREKVARRGRAE